MPVSAEKMYNIGALRNRKPHINKQYISAPKTIAHFELTTLITAGANKFEKVKNAYMIAKLQKKKNALNNDRELPIIHKHS